MELRKLTVLRIDDSLRRKKDNSPTVPQQDIPPKALALFTIGAFDRIPTWDAALKLWAEYRGDQVPDLVVADVHFEKDRSSPLSKALSGLANHLPTGLSHLKPFAAMAKAKGVLIGVGIHTADPRLWERLIDSREPRYQCMGYLAAHEIGELAAILGDVEFVRSISDYQQLTPFWEWLVTNSDNDFSIAVNVAVRNYRRRLSMLTNLKNRPDIFVMPNDLAAAHSWCAQMEKTPKPINDENDYGLTLTYRDGRRDRISIASLFADVPKITLRMLPPECFRIPEGQSDEKGLQGDEDRNVWELNYKGLPAIGAFIAFLGNLSNIFKMAADKVEAFPFKPDERISPEQNLRATTSDALVRGLVVLFHLLRIEKYKYDEWAHLCLNHKWMPRRLRFGEEYANRDTLQSALQSLIRLIKTLPDARSGLPFSREDVFEREIYNQERGYSEKLKWVTPIISTNVESEWLRWHFERLIDAGILAHRPQENYVLLSSDTLRNAPPVPSPVPPSIVENATFNRQKDWLLENLGHAGNYNAIGQIMFDAFIQPAINASDRQVTSANGKAQKGRDFIEEVINGKGPVWLTRLCSMYVVDYLQWHDPNTWPGWLRRR
jgi:hypothetical protein